MISRSFRQRRRDVWHIYDEITYFNDVLPEDWYYDEDSMKTEEEKLYCYWKHIICQSLKYRTNYMEHQPRGKATVRKTVITGSNPVCSSILELLIF